MPKYKVVRLGDDGKAYSALSYGKAEVYYEFSQWIEAPPWLAERGYFLTYFASRKLAEHFMKWLKITEKHDYVLYRCAAKGILTKLPRRSYCDGLRKGIILPTQKSWPRGTKMAKAIMLLERIA
jgi:hypothetical protein